MNAVSLGSIQTEMLDRLFQANPEAVEHFTTSQPIGRMGIPKEVENAVLWLCSEASSFVTGQSISVDGGYNIPCNNKEHSANKNLFHT